MLHLVFKIMTNRHIFEIKTIKQPYSTAFTTDHKSKNVKTYQLLSPI